MLWLVLLQLLLLLWEMGPFMKNGIIVNMLKKPCYMLFTSAPGATSVVKGLYDASMRDGLSG